MRVVLLLLWLAPALSAAKAPPIPGEGTADERARALVEAIRKNDPALAAPFFFPKEPFRKVKGIKDPDKYFDYLFRVYEKDIQTLREEMTSPDEVTFVRFELGGWKRWVERGKEANRLPYHAAYKSKLVVKDGDRERTILVRVMITWDGQWYVTHLLRKTLNEKLDRRLIR